MKKQIYSAVASLLAILATEANSAEISGGSIGLSYSAFTDNTSINTLEIEGAAELAFNKNLSLQFDLSHRSFGQTNQSTNAIGLHGIYHLNDLTSFGAFYTREDLASQKLTTIGLEAGHESGQMEYEGYIGRVSSSSDDGTLLGVNARYDFGNDYGLTGSYDQLSGTGDRTSRFGLRLDRNVGEDFNLFVEVGSFKFGSGIGAETFVGFGGKYVFGAERGATFETRGLTAILPGF